MINLFFEMGTSASHPSTNLSLLSAELEKENYKTLVLHVHGGLVSRECALKRADDLSKKYQDEGKVLPAFVIWETDILQILQEKAQRIVSAAFESLTDIFQKKITDKVAKIRNRREQEHTFGIETHLEYQLSNEEVNLLRAEIDQNEEIQILLAKERDEEDSMTEMGAFSDNIFKITKVVTYIKEIVDNVVQRFVDKTDHGIHATIVEEILKKTGLYKISKSSWDHIKEKSRGIFQNSDFGTVLLTKIQHATHLEKIVLIGHSAGSIFICELLQKALEINFNKKFDVILAAPACSFAKFHATQPAIEKYVDRLRIFNMSDEIERNDFLLNLSFNKLDAQNPKYKLLPHQHFYPSSLLYLVSGIMEDNVDEPLLGMERYFKEDHYAQRNVAVREVKHFLESRYNASKNLYVWSKTEDSALDGLRCHSKKHSGFFEETLDPHTIPSIKAILAKGF